MILRGKRSLELVEGALDEVHLLLVALPDLLQVLVRGTPAGLEVVGLGPLALQLGHLVLELLEPLGDLQLAVLLDGLLLALQLDLEVGQLGVALLVVDHPHEVGREVDDLLQLLGLQLVLGLGAREQVGQPGAGAAQVPDVDHGGGQLDVAHALAPDLRAGHLDAAALTDDALEADALVLAAVALPVLGGPEDLLAEQAVLLRLERAVVDRLGLLDLAVGPRADRVRRGQGDRELVEVVDVEHECCLFSTV